MLIDAARHLVPLGDLDPVHATPLTDAGLTPCHAIRAVLVVLSVLSVLVPGSNAVVIGVGGGLGHLAVQILKHVSPYRETLPELVEVIGVAQKGDITPVVRTFPLEQAGEAYAALRAGALEGREVIIPGD